MVEGKDYGKLKDILAADPYADDSFAKSGYVLKESKPMGLKGGFYLIYVKTADDSLVLKLKARLAVLPTLKELEGPDFESVVSQIEAQEDSAASGFGSLFGD